MTFSAIAWNAIIGAARAHRMRELDSGPGRPLTQTRDASIIRVVNATGLDLGRYSVVGLDGPVFTPDDSIEAFLREVAMVAVVPTADHRGKFGVLLSPCPSDPTRAARCYVHGVIQVLVDVTDPEHKFAEVEAGNTTNLVSAECGSARILHIDDEPYYGGLRWGIIRFGTVCGGTSSGGSTTPDRCRCPEDSYEVEGDCGLCGAYYSGGTVMPRFWWLTIHSAQGSAYSEPCEGTPCIDLAGKRILLAYEDDGGYGVSCVWTGAGSGCVVAELTVSGDDWQITITDPADCVLAVLRLPVESFSCCGTNAGWESDPSSACELSVTLEPHECTCCPDPTCPPPDPGVVCTDTDCCVQGCNCLISVTVSNLATIPGLPCEFIDDDCETIDGEPCNFGDVGCFKPGTVPPPDERCGGMNGVYNLVWAENCTWRFRGVPAGSGSVEVAAELTLSGRTWTFTLLGPNGQTATFRKADWDCSHLIGMAYVGGSCPIAGTPPSASFGLCLFD
jgi:hypothetical protein